MKNAKKILLILCVLTCVFSLSSCSNKKDDSVTFEYTESDLVSYITADTKALSEATDEELDTYIKNSEQDKDNAYIKDEINSWKDTVEDSGKFVEFVLDKDGNTKYSVTEDDKEDTVTISVKAKFEKRKVSINYIFAQEDGSIKITSAIYEPHYTLGEKMEEAALNTVIGLSVVVLVLAFLSVFISLFKYINKAETAVANRKNKKNMDSTVEQIIEKEQNSDDYTDDLELVAVITAAIASIEKKSTDGFCVRSIRKVPSSKWKNS